MVTAVIPPGRWIFIVPTAIVDGNLHFSRIAIVHAVAASIVLAAVEVLWIVNVWIVVKPVAIASARRSTPIGAERVGASGRSTVERTACGSRSTSAIAVDAVVCINHTGRETQERRGCNQPEDCLLNHVPFSPGLFRSKTYAFHSLPKARFLSKCTLSIGSQETLS